MVVVNSAMIMTYYETGTIINKRKTWGRKYIQNPANDLKEYGKGYSTQNLKYMVKFAKEFSIDEFSQQLADKLIPWYTLIEILYKSKSREEILWYIKKSKSYNQIFKNIYRYIFNYILSSFLICSLSSCFRSLFVPYFNINLKNCASSNKIIILFFQLKNY